MKSGELTKKEAVNLRASQKNLHPDIEMAKSDGSISKSERKVLKKTKIKTAEKFLEKNTIKKNGNK